ncbi:enoyl-CoA hydratase/isomerase family protein [Hydrogenophaga sp. A37]|uniref:enoyl-CoA hydratase/isomerase family protein n=1 Tax=Hydrogenophaga sp. A37 TaxID=1945864 RepID=UPI000984ACA1|nr:enoyl-CoA hydratase-related protein [Hydrogenophaga sp. A37]OOG88658.1 crotonase [Hydrogenophaga sp. A37]
MPSSKLLLESEAGVLTLALNRPDKLNAIDNALAEALLDALNAAATDPSVRTIRLRGNGRAFCAGRDVGAAPTDRDLELVQAVSRAIVAHPRPVIAAVHGWTVGAGFEWMMNADIVYAAADTRFKLPEASLGVFVTGGLVTTLPSAIGPMRAKALMLLGETFDAAQALDWGLVYRCVPADELDAVSLAAARQIADLKPEVATQFKRVLNQFGLEQFDRAVEEESRVQRLLGRDDLGR